MIGLRFDREPRIIACLGAHPDDIEIGAAGTLRQIADRYANTRFEFVILAGDETRQAEATESALALLGDRATVSFGGFGDRYLPYRDPGSVKDFLFDTVTPLAVDLVVAPNREDMHQDHAFVAAIAGQVFRDHLVLGYEIVKYDGDLGRPQTYVPLTAEEVDVKLDHLDSHFPSQRDKPWYQREGFNALMRLRGIEASSASGYAEAFYVTKAVLS